MQVILSNNVIWSSYSNSWIIKIGDLTHLSMPLESFSQRHTLSHKHHLRVCAPSPSNDSFVLSKCADIPIQKFKAACTTVTCSRNYLMVGKYTLFWMSFITLVLLVWRWLGFKKCWLVHTCINSLGFPCGIGPWQL